jgi:peroxiredoxin
LHKDERSLVAKYKGRPFVILGVSNDPDPDLLRATQQEQRISWRSWWDEGHTVTRYYAVRGFPTLFLIDGTGTIRWTSEGKPAAAVLEKKIDELLQEVH